MCDLTEYFKGGRWVFVKICRGRSWPASPFLALFCLCEEFTSKCSISQPIITKLRTQRTYNTHPVAVESRYTGEKGEKEKTAVTDQIITKPLFAMTRVEKMLKTHRCLAVHIYTHMQH